MQLKDDSWNTTVKITVFETSQCHPILNAFLTTFATNMFR